MHIAAMSATIGLIVDVGMGGLRAMFKECRFILNVDICLTCQRDLEVTVLPPILLFRVASLLWPSDVRTHFALV